MLTRPGHHIGDTWYHVEGDSVHLFYLTCAQDTPRHTCWSIGHAVSEDLVNWRDEGVILTPGPADAWDGICPATGSVIVHEGIYWMAYTGNYAGPEPTIGLATSTDLFSWRKHEANPVLRADGIHYSLAPNEAWNKPRWRDPFLYVEDGVIHQFITATTATDPTIGAIAHATSTDMVHWDIQPPLDIPAIASDLECPKIHRVGDIYVLTVSLQDGIALPSLRDRQADGHVLATAYCLTAAELCGPYTLHGDGRILAMPNSPYACEPVFFQERYHLLGTIWDDDTGDRVSDPLPLSCTPEGFRQASP